MGNTVVPNRPDMESMKSERSDATIWTMLGYQNVNFKDNVDVVGSLPTVGNEVDDFRLVQENGFVYRWDGSAWTQVSVGGGISSIVPGQNVWINDTDPANPVIGATFDQSGKYVISGGAVRSGTGLTYNVSLIEYFFDTFLVAQPTTFTLDAADPTDDRIDVVVVDREGNVSIVQGTPSSNPIVPAITDDQLLVQLIIVEAGQLTPTFAYDAIYIDNADWTGSTYQTSGSAVGTTNFASTNNPYQGTVCVQNIGQNRTTGNRFVAAAPIALNDYDLLSLRIRFDSVIATAKTMNAFFTNGAGATQGAVLNLFNYGLQRNAVNQWQLVVVPRSAFGIGLTVQQFRIILAGGTTAPVNWDLDYMYLTAGTVPVPAINIVESIVPGTNISVDTTDPKNPIVSYSGVNKSQITVEITPAELIGYTTPIEMIPAPGPGKILYVGFWFYEIIMVTTPYNSGTYRFNLTNQTGTLDALAVGNLTPTSDARGNSILAGPALPNTPLLFTLQNVPTLGDSIVKFTFDYQIIDV